MPVTKSAKKALAVAHRRHAENLIHKESFKQAVKAVKKAVIAGSGEISKLFSTAQSTLDKAAKSKTIHPNKAARLKSRLAKKIVTTEAPVAKKAAVKRAATKKAVPKKATVKKEVSK